MRTANEASRAARCNPELRARLDDLLEIFGAKEKGNRLECRVTNETRSRVGGRMGLAGLMEGKV